MLFLLYEPTTFLALFQQEVRLSDYIKDAVGKFVTKTQSVYNLTMRITS